MGESLSELIRRTDQALDAGDYEEVARSRLAIVQRRLENRSSSEQQPLIEGDVAVIVLAAGDMQRLEEHERALELLAAAKDYATQGSWSHWRVRASLHGVLSLVALLDFDAAASVLRDTLGLALGAPLDDASARDRARELVIPGIPGGAAEWLRGEALVALGRYLAAAGALDAAHAALTALLDAPPNTPAPNGVDLLSVPDVAVYTAALCIDRGAYAEFDALRRIWCTDDTSGAVRDRWLLLEGGALAAQGYYSEARDRLTVVAERTVPPAQRTQVQAARWQLAQALLVLNRMDEAQAVLDALVRDGAGEYDVDALAALFESRRSGAAVAFHPLAAPREMAVGALHAQETPPRLKKGNGEQSDARIVIRPERRYERVRDDWAHVANAAQLDIANGDIATAGARLAALTSWMPSVRSPLLWGRYLRLAAIAAYFRGQFAEAAELAEAGRARFQELGMPADQWDASRLRYRALLAAGASRSDIDAEAQRGHDLLADIQSRLDPIDRSLYLLNKWSTVDDAITARLVAVDHVPAGFRRQRALRRALQDLAVVRRWEAPGRRPGAERAEDPAPPEGTDVFAFVRSQEHARRGRRPRWGERLSLRPLWLERDAALLHFAVLPTRVEAILMHRAGCERLDISRIADRATLFDATAHALQKLSSATSRTWPDVAPELSTLAEMLGMSELAAALPPSIKRLAIVLDDVIVHVPFAALPFRGRPLVEHVVPTVIPYTRWLARSSTRNGRYAGALAVGVRKPPYQIRHEGRLREYERLADPATEIAAMAPLSDTEPETLTEGDASVDGVIAALQRVQLAHFVCHGDFFAGRPNPSKLLLWDKPLEVPHIQGASLRPLRFVSMGACWAAGTRVLPGREMVGMPTALLESGAEAVLASLWALRDAPAGAFIGEVYSAMGNAPAVDAVATAQRTWIRDRPVTDWASYQIYAAGLPARPVVRAALALLERVFPESNRD